MNALLKKSLAVCAMALTSHSFAQVTFYQNQNFQGQTFTTSRQVSDFQRFGFNDRASSVVVDSDRWEVCDNIRFKGRCAVLRPGRYPSLAAMGLNDRVSSVRVISRNARIADSRYAPAYVPSAVAVAAPVAPVAAPAPAGPQVVFYEDENFQGRTFTAQNQIDDFTRFGFNDRARSVVVIGDRWEACDNVRFGGKCVVLRPGRYPSLVAMGMDDRVSSVRAVPFDARVDDNRYAPLPSVAAYDNRRRNDERLYEVNVSTVRAVVGAPEQRCWMEPAAVPAAAARGNPNVGGAIAGALIGGILGHQVGGGTGKDLATIGGAVGGAALGANVGRTAAATPPAPDVQRCTTQPSAAQPAYWDVTYNFRGQEHRVQMTSAPGPTITVNGQGEPRT